MSSLLLETVDIPAVEILSTGGPVHGTGSPPEGDFWTRDQLEEMATAARELATEIKAPNKIGHNDAQTLVKNSALAVPTPGEMPAVGWLDGATAQVVDGEDGVEAVLVMDARDVPKAFAQLVKAKAYRTRSAELSRVTSQITQKTYDWVVTGLAWLGAKLPAVQTLADVVALYERAEINPPENVRAYVVYAADTAGQVVWDPEAGFQDLRDDVAEALNGPATGGANEPRFWVYDIAVAVDRALVQDYYSDGNDGYVVPFTQNADGSITIAPSSDWTAVEQGWLAAAKEFARKNERSAESRQMALELTDTDVALLREKLGLDTDTDVTPETLAAAAEQRANELAEATRKLEAADTGTEDRVRKLEQDLETERKRSFEQRRDSDIKEALRTRELDPADTEKWQKRYESLGEDNARELLFELPKRNLTRELGADGDDLGDDGLTDEQRRSFESELSEVFPGYEPREVTV